MLINKDFFCSEKDPIGDGLAAVIIVPALNEEENLPSLIESIKKQKTTRPVGVIVVDNGSTDDTAKIAQKYGVKVLFCRKRSIGAARQTGIDFILNHSSSLDNLIVIQLDADVKIIDENFIESVVSAYQTDKKLMVTIGPIVYHIKDESNNEYTIDRGRQYRELSGFKDLREYFKDYGRDINDYLIPAVRHRFLPGTNTAYRASVFKLKNVKFPQDNSWESIVISIRIQQHINESQIKFLESQKVEASNRSIVDKNGILTNRKRREFKKKGYIRPFKVRKPLSPFETIITTIKQIEMENHG